MLALGAALGCMAGCLLAQVVGRRYTLLVCAVGFGGAWTCLFMASTTLLLYIGRFSTGFFTGIVSLCVPTYIAEVATPDSRGPLVSIRTRCPGGTPRRQSPRIASSLVDFRPTLSGKHTEARLEYATKLKTRPSWHRRLLTSRSLGDARKTRGRR